MAFSCADTAWPSCDPARMPAAPLHLTLFQGDDWDELTIRLRQADGTYEDLTGKQARAQIRPEKGSDELYAEIDCQILDQTKDDERGKIALFLTWEQTRDIPAGQWVWDMQLANEDGTKVKTRLAGRVVVEAQVTR